MISEDESSLFVSVPDPWMDLRMVEYGCHNKLPRIKVTSRVGTFLTQSSKGAIQR